MPRQNEGVGEGQNMKTELEKIAFSKGNAKPRPNSCNNFPFLVTYHWVTGSLFLKQLLN